ncbi:MAG: ATP-dependent sacrificial sulfur transferase LarE, partial [Methanobacteriota archaeon]
MNIQDKLSALQRIITEHSPLLIAYSGGVDSALLAALTLETVGPERMQCILVDGPELPRHDLNEACITAKTLGLPLEVVIGEPLKDDLRQENPHDRCRHCKLGTFNVLNAAAAKYSCTSIADGANASDSGEHRPGISAFSSCGVIHPFIMASITKTEIRKIARMKNLPFWDKPSSACLYSRIPYGEEITDEKLQMIEQAEDLLINLGFRQVRVRH